MPAEIRRTEAIRATQAAARLRVKLGLPTYEPVDVFGAIRKLGIWLTFQKLDNLLGATVRNGAGGILITTERPLSIQRYTAAHELGHWVLHEDTYTGDTDATILQGSPSVHEQAAQVFAASFLMPRPLVQRTLRNLGHNHGDPVSPAIAYQASRDMGVSYEAGLTQLRSLKVIDQDRYMALRRERPIDIKTALAGGIRPVDATANVWHPSTGQSDRLNIAVGDEVFIDIPENRTTGYRWTIVGTPTRTLPRSPFENDEAAIELAYDKFTPDVGGGAGTRATDQKLIGSGGHRRMIIRAKSSGKLELPLALVRPFQRNSTALKEFSVHGHVMLEPARVQARIIAGLDSPERPFQIGGSDA